MSKDIDWGKVFNECIICGDFFKMKSGKTKYCSESCKEEASK